jgi:homospermidine synthase
VGENKSSPIYRATCHYAYHPCDDAMLSLDEMFGLGRPQAKHVIHLDAGALWYGSRLTNAEACKLAPNQNATGLQVSSAVLAGMVWTLENPSAGIVEADEMNHTRIGLRCMVVGPTTFWTMWTKTIRGSFAMSL